MLALTWLLEPGPVVLIEPELVPPLPKPLKAELLLLLTEAEVLLLLLLLAEPLLALPALVLPLTLAEPELASWSLWFLTFTLLLLFRFTLFWSFAFTVLLEPGPVVSMVPAQATR